MDSSSVDNHRDKPGLFTIPTPVKKIFDKVPLVTYPPNQLPQGSSRCDKSPSLYVFSTEQDAIAGKPSFNPSCLKWQTFLKIVGIEHEIIASNNHASPTGSLPFFLPAFHGANRFSENVNPVVAEKLLKYSKELGANIQDSSSMRYSAYQSLIDFRIRNAWLYFLYLELRNFNEVAYPLYVSSASSNFFVRASISHQLRAAAESELLKHSSVIDIDDIYSEADKAFEALSTLLGENNWFFGNEKPALFDASVFAYSNLLLDENMGWQETKLCRALRIRTNLVQHRERILKKYYNQN